TEKPKETFVRYIPGEGVTFWQRAEALVLEALRDYARHAANGGPLQRQLFADDAERGFAFIDICQRRFDVVLMNPPFAEPSRPSKRYINQRFPQSKNDILGLFVELSLERLHNGGCLGAITSRNAFFLSSMASWRSDVVFHHGTLMDFADFGDG